LTLHSLQVLSTCHPLQASYLLQEVGGVVVCQR